MVNRHSKRLVKDQSKILLLDVIMSGVFIMVKEHDVWLSLSKKNGGNPPGH